ncbi:hypothetical protein BGP_3825 [Beggiatoa sp. PS]|nr:hypothetical protein BGP_3825 [Beggiatoa sp. PS]
MSEKSLIKMLENSNLDISPDELHFFLQEWQDKKQGSPETYTQEYLENLLLLYRKFNDNNEFTPGQLVRWKPGLKNRKLPQENQPAVVIDVLDTPIYADTDPGTPYFHEPLDIALALIGKMEELSIFLL